MPICNFSESNTRLKQEIHFFKRLQKRGMHCGRIRQNVHTVQDLKKDFVAGNVMTNISFMSVFFIMGCCLQMEKRGKERCRVLRILIADDEADEREVILFLLKKYGFQAVIQTAANGQEALDLLQKDPPDILITDVQMPFLSGTELAHPGPAAAAKPADLLFQRP